MIATGSAPDASGVRHDVASAIAVEYAEALYRMTLQRTPDVVLEVGMAFGFASLAILTALEKNGRGRLISVDPFQMPQWHGVGVNNVHRSGFAPRHQLIEKLDYVALPELLAAGTKAELAYIDGWHTFDYTLLDFFYIDKMLKKGGVVAFNDAGYRAVHRVLSFVTSHRKYREIDSGLKTSYKGRTPLTTLARWIKGMNVNDRYFEKVEEWEPDWNFYAAF